MAITVTLAGTDRTSQISRDQLQIQHIIGAQRDTATLVYRKFGSRSYIPTMFDTVLIQDNGVAIFGGRIIHITETLIIRSFSLTDLLQQLLLPANTPIDPNEVSEMIKTDLGEVTITESITLHSSPDHTDTATVTIAESIAHDPLGAHVAPTWVLGPYIPSEVSDTKPVINIQRASAVLY
jgi:hypothetical protein